MNVVSRRGASMPMVIGIVVVILVIVGALMFLRSAPGGDNVGMTVTLDRQNNSNESGTAKFIEEAGKLKVVLALTGTLPDASEPAHIHAGSCANLGGPKYTLIPLAGGKSETMLDMTLDKLLLELPLAVNVHKSATEASVYVSCGDIPGNNTAAQEGNGGVAGAPAAQGKTYTVEITEAGFKPATLTIATGDTVEFLNKDKIPHWPASGPHPTHTNYPPLNIGFLKQGESHLVTFPTVGKFGFHDHIHESDTRLQGIIEVYEE